MRNMGVDLDQKKGNLYRTFGADYYRRNLKSVVKGNSQLDIDFEKANDVMKDETNNFPEFANYVINSNYDKRLMVEGSNNNEFGGLDLNIDLGFNNINNDNNMDLDLNVINNPLDNNNINNNENNINDIQINTAEKKIESVENKPPENDQNENKIEDKKVDVDKKEDGDSAERRVKRAMQLSYIGIKKLGNFMKKSGIKGYDLAKKYGKATAKVASEYVKNNFQKKNEDKK